VAPFRPIMSMKKSTCVVQQVLNTIRRGEYMVGSHLPPERVLASEMDTSRASVREALSILQGLGIIETRPGDGTYVRKQVEDLKILGRAQVFLQEAEDLIQIWEARKQIETALVVLAIDRCDSRTLQDARDALSLMRQTAEEGEAVAYLSANRKFHVCIGKMSRNTPLVEAVEALSQVTTNQLLEKVNREYVLSSLEGSLRKHEAILNAIADKDKEAATEAVRFHFQDLEWYFRKSLKDL